MRDLEQTCCELTVIVVVFVASNWICLMLHISFRLNTNAEQMKSKTDFLFAPCIIEHLITL